MACAPRVSPSNIIGVHLTLNPFTLRRALPPKFSSERYRPSLIGNVRVEGHFSDYLILRDRPARKVGLFVFLNKLLVDGTVVVKGNFCVIISQEGSYVAPLLHLQMRF